MEQAKQNGVKRLSPSQIGVLSSIAEGIYRPTVMQARTVRALIAAGLVVEQAGHPPTYIATGAGRTAVAKATDSAA